VDGEVLADLLHAKSNLQRQRSGRDFGGHTFQGTSL